MLRHRTARFLSTTLLATGVYATLPVGDAQACGGFFCSQNQPVNQAAERIVFSQNADDTVTAIIQIMYEGPSESFSWLLPISSVPNPETDEIAVSSDIAFQRLQAATNPSYSLTVRVEGECKPVENELGDGSSFNSSSSGTGGTGGGLPGNTGGVTVQASGVVGSFEWSVISLDPELDEPTDAAVNWLESNGYDVTAQGAELIAPYLEDGMYLLALKLVKGADTGAIRPIVLTYDAGEPMIPIKLTAVAANNDMGVMTWLLGNARSVPKNYLALELNEAQINWFNASSNYNDVVIAAAKEGGGQGFVTEFAGTADTLSNTIWTQYDDSTWAAINDTVYQSFSQIFDATFYTYGSWDGYWEAVRSTITLPDGVSYEDFQLCPSCYSNDISGFSPSAYLAAIDEQVIQPVKLMQELFDSQTYATRLYTTMSAADMTLDPSFTFNGDLPDLSNLHTAERIIECNPNIYEFDAPWRIEFPQGTVIRGTAEQANSRSWPSAVSEQPANFKITQLSGSGQGELVTDNSAEVEKALEEYNDSLDLPTSSDGGSGGSASGSGGSTSKGSGGTDPGADGGEAKPSNAGGGGGCSVAENASDPTWFLALGMLGLSLWRRRKPTAGRA